MKFGKYLLAATALAAAPAVVHAQDVGATITGNDDAAVGTVVSNDGTVVVVDTGTHEAPLPAEAIGGSEGAWTVNATKAQIDSMMAEQLAAQEAQQAEAQAQAEAEAAAALAAALVVGAPVVTADAQSLGTVDEIAGENVIVKSEDDQLVTLTTEMLAVDENGSLMALANLADIQAALEAQGG